MKKEELDELAFQARISERCRQKLSNYFYKRCIKITQLALGNYQMSGVEPEDYLLSYEKALQKSVKLFDSTKGDFEKFFISIFIQRIYSDIAYDFYRNYYLHTSMSLDTSQSDKHEDVSLYEIITSDASGGDPRYELYFGEKTDLLLSEGSASNYRDYKKNYLQRYIFLLKFAGYSTKEIAKMFGVSAKIITRAQSDDRDFSILSDIKNEHL